MTTPSLPKLDKLVSAIRESIDTKIQTSVSELSDNINRLQDNVNTKADDNNVIHKSGNETIHGTKIFSGVIHRYADLTTSGGAQVYRFDDTNANPCGHIYNNVHWTGDAVYNRHGAYNNKSGKSMEIDIISPDSGVGMAYVSGTATKGNVEAVTSATGHTGLATMGWVNNPATSTNVVHRTGNETITGTKTFTSTISFTNITIGGYTITID